MQISITSPTASPVRFKSGRLLVGIAPLRYYSGYSIALNCVRMGDVPFINGPNVSWSNDNITAGYFTADGEVAANLRSGTSVRFSIMSPSRNPGENLAGEDFTFFHEGTSTGINNSNSLGITNKTYNAATKSGTFKAVQEGNWLALNISDPADPPTNVRIVQTRYLNDVTFDGITYPGFLNGGEFNPHWLHEVRKAGILRFMDPLQTNYSPITDFSQFSDDNTVCWARTQLSTLGACPPKYGIPLGAICRIAEQTGCDVYINIPHRLGTNDSDDSIIQLATFFRDNMPTGQKVWFEWSNETWNFASTGFLNGQKTYAQASAAGVGLPANNGAQYTGYRASQCMKIISDVFNDRTRWRGVLATWSLFASNTTSMIAGFDAWNTATGSGLQLSDLFDAIAGTCYFGEYLTEWSVSSIVKGNPTTITASGFSSVNVGDEMVICLRRLAQGASPGMAEIDGLYGTVLSKNGTTITVNIDSSGFSDWSNTGETYAIPSKYPRLMDESERLNIDGDPKKYFRQQMAQLCRTGTCDFGITMSTDYTLDKIEAQDWPNQKAIADQYGLQLMQYEGGCHLVGATMLTGFVGNPTMSQNTVGDRFRDYVRDFGHSAEIAAVYSDSYQRFTVAGGVFPAKYVEAGSTNLFGTWGGIRFWPTVATPNGDMDNPVWKAVKAASAVYFAP